MIKTSQTNRKIVCVLMCVCAVCVTNYETLNECLFVKSARARQEEVGKKQQQQQTDWIY